MAGNVTFNINDADSARQWLQYVQAINEDYFTAMKEAGECLESMSDFCDGTIVDEFYKYGTAILNAAEKTFNALDMIADTVNKVLDTVTNFTENVVGAIGGALSKAFGQ